MGRELMKKRADKKKKDNIKELGDDPEELKDYIHSGAAKLDKNIKRLTAAEVPRDDNVSNQDEIEVNVHHIKPKKKGRRVYGQTEQWKFNTAAEELKPEQVNVQNSGDFKKGGLGAKGK